VLVIGYGLKNAPKKKKKKIDFTAKKSKMQKAFNVLQKTSKSITKVTMVLLPLVMSWIDLFSKAWVVREQMYFVDINWVVVASLITYLILERGFVANYLAEAYYVRGEEKSTERRCRKYSAAVAQFFGLLILYETLDTLLIRSVKECILKCKKKREQKNPTEDSEEKRSTAPGSERPRTSTIRLTEMNNKIQRVKRGKLQLSFYAHRILYLQVVYETIPLFVVQFFYYYVIMRDFKCLSKDKGLLSDEVGSCLSVLNVYISVLVIGYGLYENDRYKFDDSLPGGFGKSWKAQLTRLYCRLYEVLSRVIVLCVYLTNLYNVAGEITGTTLLLMFVPWICMEIILFYMFLIEWNDHCLAEGQRKDNIIDHFMSYAPNMIYLADINVPSILRWHSTIRFYETFYITILGIVLVSVSMIFEKGNYSGNAFNNDLILPMLGCFLMWLKFWFLLNIVLSKKIKPQKFISNLELHNAILQGSNRHTRSLALRSRRDKLKELDNKRRNPLHCATLVCDKKTFILILGRLKGSQISSKKADWRKECLLERELDTGMTVLHTAAISLPKDENVDTRSINELTKLKGKYEDMKKAMKAVNAGSTDQEINDEFEAVCKKYDLKKKSLMIDDNDFNLISIILDLYEKEFHIKDDIKDDNGRRALIACDDDHHTLYHKAAMLGNHMAIERLLRFSQGHDEEDEPYEKRGKLQDIALIDGKGNTCLHLAVIASRTQEYICPENHELCEKNLATEKKGKTKKKNFAIETKDETKEQPYKCIVCDIPMSKGIIWVCPEDHSETKGDFTVCDDCYMKSKNALESDQRTQGLYSRQATSLFSNEVITEIAEAMTLPQLLIANTNKKTAFDLAVEKGKPKAALELHNIIKKKMVSVFRNSEGSKFEDFLPKLGLRGLDESFKTRGVKPSRKRNLSGRPPTSLFEGNDVDVAREILKKTLRYYWGEAAMKYDSKDSKVKKGYLYYYVHYFCESLLATKHLWDQAREEQQTGGTYKYLNVHREMKMKETKTVQSEATGEERLIIRNELTNNFPSFWNSESTKNVN